MSAGLNQEQGSWCATRDSWIAQFLIRYTCKQFKNLPVLHMNVDMSDSHGMCANRWGWNRID